MNPRIRQLRDGETPPEGTPRRYKNSSGYIRLRWKVSPSELVECYEHRLVAGARAGDHVHHINHITDDNRPENLKVVSPREHRNEHRRIDREAAAELYEQGLSTPQIAGELGCDTATAYRAVRSVRSTRTISESLTKDLPTDIIRQLHAAGLGSRRIGAALGVSGWAIDQRLRAMGLRRGPGRRPRADEERGLAALRALGLAP